MRTQNLFRYLAVFAICFAALSITMPEAMAKDWVSSSLYSSESPDESAGTAIGEGLANVAQWVFWVFYLLGGIFMGIGAFKLKQGDMGGFGKNMAGGATLFFVPAAIKLFQGIGAGAAGHGG